MDHHDGASSDDVRVLFVEDDSAIAQMYRLRLELDGYRVEVAGDGELALQTARSSRPDIIFLDMRLPKLDGIAVLEALRADPLTRTVPVVILSSRSEKELVEHGARLGVLDHLIKSKTTPAMVTEGMARWLRLRPSRAAKPGTPPAGPRVRLAFLRASGDEDGTC